MYDGLSWISNGHDQYTAVILTDVPVHTWHKVRATDSLIVLMTPLSFDLMRFFVLVLIHNMMMITVK